MANASASAALSWLRSLSGRQAALLALDSAGLLCAFKIFHEHCYTTHATFGPSMYPTLDMRGESILIAKRHRHGKDVRVGDVVTYRHPFFLGEQAAKRVLGMPGDYVCKEPPLATAAGGDGEMIQVPEGHIYVVGDNLPWSRDSRQWGPLPLGLVNGKVVARVWPPHKMGYMHNTLETARFSDD